MQTPDRGSPCLVSIVIVAYNARPHLARCVRSLLDQSYAPVEILLVDNASRDGGVDEVVARCPRVRAIRSPRNRGYAGGNNLGAAHARGDYIAVLNPDTEVDPGWLAALVGALAADAGAGLATSKILLFDRRDRINTCGNDVHYTGLATCRGLRRPATEFVRPQEVAAVSGAAFLIRRSLFERLGGFDERFFMYLEDTDLSWRAALAGYRCLFVPTSIVYHHYAPRLSATKTFYLERNRALMLLQNCRAATLLLLLPALLLAEAATWGYCLARGPAYLRAKARAYRWLVGHTRAIGAARRRVQALRRVDDGVILRRLDHRLPLDQVVPRPLATIAQAPFAIPLRLWYGVIIALLGRPADEPGRGWEGAPDEPVSRRGRLPAPVAPASCWRGR